jgi:hypothetical protein
MQRLRSPWFALQVKQIQLVALRDGKVSYQIDPQDTPVFLVRYTMPNSRHHHQFLVLTTDLCWWDHLSYDLQVIPLRSLESPDRFVLEPAIFAFMQSLS